MDDLDHFMRVIKGILRRCYCPKSVVEQMTPTSKLYGGFGSNRFLGFVTGIEKFYGIRFSQGLPVSDILSTPETLYKFISEERRMITNDHTEETHSEKLSAK